MAIAFTAEMFWIALFSLAIAASASSCTDGKDNVIEIEDVSGGNLDIHFTDVTGLTYDAKNGSSCHGSEAEVRLPGMIKLIKGAISVTAANDLKTSGEIRYTLKKNSGLVGYICKDGKSKEVGVSDKQCKSTVLETLGAQFTQLLSTPGTYNLAQIEAMGGFGNVIPLKSISGSLNTIVKGEWQGQLAVYSNGRQVAAIKVPANKPWIYVS